MIQVRPVCGGLAEAMDQVKEYENLNDFIDDVTKKLVMFSHMKIDRKKFTTKIYGYDARIDCETWIIMYDGKPVAYSNGELK